MASRKGPFGRAVRDHIAVVDKNYKIVALFAEHNNIGAAGYIKGRQESAGKFGWADPELRAVTVDGEYGKGQHVPAPCRRCGAKIYREPSRPNAFKYGLTVVREENGYAVKCTCGAGCWSAGKREEAVVGWNDLQKEREHVREGGAI